MKNFITILKDVNIKIKFNTDLIVNQEKKQKGTEMIMLATVSVYKNNSNYEYEVFVENKMLNTIFKEDKNKEILEFEFENKNVIDKQIADLQKEIEKTTTQK